MNSHSFLLSALGLSLSHLLLLEVSPGAAQPYRFFPNTNPGIQRSLIIPHSSYGYGQASPRPYAVQNNITIIDNNSSCFNCYRRGNGRRYYRGYPYSGVHNSE